MMRFQSDLNYSSNQDLFYSTYQHLRRNISVAHPGLGSQSGVTELWSAPSHFAASSNVSVRKMPSRAASLLFLSCDCSESDPRPFIRRAAEGLTDVLVVTTRCDFTMQADNLIQWRATAGSPAESSLPVLGVDKGREQGQVAGELLPTAVVEPMEQVKAEYRIGSDAEAVPCLRLVHGGVVTPGYDVKARGE